MTAKLLKIDKPNEFINIIRKASELFRQRQELSNALWEAEGHCEDYLDRLTRKPEKAIILMLQNDLFQQQLFEELSAMVVEKQAYERDGMGDLWPPLSSRRLKRKGKRKRR